MAHSNDNLGSVMRYQIESQKLHQQGQKSITSAADTTQTIEQAIVDLAQMDIESAFVKLRALVSMIKDKPGHNVVAFPGAAPKRAARPIFAAQ